MGFLPFWPPLPTGSPDDPGGGGVIVATSDTDTVRVAAVPSTDPDPDSGYANQQPGGYGDPILCSVDDLRVHRTADTTPFGQEQFKLTSTTSFGVTQTDQLISWLANANGPIMPSFVLRSVGREIPPNSASEFYTCYATGRD